MGILRKGRLRATERDRLRNQARDGSCTELAHDPCPMDLDSSMTDSELDADRLVGEPPQYACQHFALAWRETIEGGRLSASRPTRQRICRASHQSLPTDRGARLVTVLTSICSLNGFSRKALNPASEAKRRNSSVG